MLTRLLTGTLLIFASFFVQAKAVSAAPVIKLTILADGSLQVEGKTYSGRSAIAAEIEHLGKRKPQPLARFKIDKHATYDEVAQILARIQRTGAVSVGIVSTQK